VTADGLPFRTPGQMLREAREARGLDQQELARRTKIPPRLLAALEIDDYQQLSADLYVKSFLRSCAQELGLDVQEVLDLHRRMTEQQSAAEVEQTWEAEVEVERVKGIPWGPVLRVAGAAALVLLVVLTVVRIGRRSVDSVTVDRPAAETAIETPAGSAAEPSAAEPVVPAQDVSADAPVGESAAGTGEPDADATVPRDATLDADAGRSETPAAEVRSVRTPAKVVALPSGDPTLVFADGRRRSLVLRLVGPTPLAVAVAADGTEVEPLPAPSPADIPDLPATGIESGRLYRAGDRYAAYWGGDDYFYVRLDRIEGVEMTLNGRVIEIPRGVVGREWELNADKAGP